MEPSSDSNSEPKINLGLKILFIILLLFLAVELGYFYIKLKARDNSISVSLTNFFLKNTDENSLLNRAETTDLTNLNTSYTQIKNFTIITKEDIKSGRLSEKEKKFISIPKNKLINMFFYKIRIEKNKWLAVVGLKIENKNQSISFLHYSIGIYRETDKLSRENIKISFAKFLDDSYFDKLGLSRSYFSNDQNFYRIGGVIEILISKWNREEIVPQELEKIILFGN